MFRNLAAIFLLLSFACVTHASGNKCSSAKYSPYVVNSMGLDHDAFGTLPKPNYFEFSGFVGSFDNGDDDNSDGVPDQLAIPNWVSYVIPRYGEPLDGRFTSPPKSARPSKWYEMKSLNNYLGIHELPANRLDDSYRGEGKVYHRGHLAMKKHLDRVSFEAGCNSHHFVNAMPQRVELNTGIWLFLERLSGAWANQFNNVWVTTGPIFDKETIKFIGDPGEVPVAIPDAAFKLLHIRGSEGVKSLAFIFPQTSEFYFDQDGRRSCNDYSLKDLARYQVSIAEVEKRSGLSFGNTSLLNKTEIPELWSWPKGYFSWKCF